MSLLLRIMSEGREMTLNTIWRVHGVIDENDVKALGFYALIILLGCEPV